MKNQDPRIPDGLIIGGPHAYHDCDLQLPIRSQIARSRLESEEVPTFVAKEHTVNMQWLYSSALGRTDCQPKEQPAHCWGFRGMTGDEARDLKYSVNV